MKKSILGITTFACIGLTGLGCASSSSAHSSVSTQSVHIEGEGSALLTRDTYSDTDMLSSPIDQVWAVMPDVFAALEVPVTYRVPQEFAMGNLSFNARTLGGERMSEWIYCGRNVTTGRPHADTYDVNISVRTVLSEQEGREGTGVTTWVEGSARSRGASGDPVNCTTSGDLEARILELMQLELARRAVAGG